MGGIVDQEKDKPSNQESKALNQETKVVILMSRPPQPIGETVAAPGLLAVLDPREGQLCWLITSAIAMGERGT